MADPAAETSDATPALPLTLGYATGETRGRRYGWAHLIFFIAVVVRLAYSLTKSADPMSVGDLPDQREYWQIARSIVQHDGLRFDDAITSEYLYAFRMPGYPLFVAACGASLPVVRGVQAVVDGLSALAAFFLGRRLRGHAAGVVAGLGVAAHPYLIFFSATLLSETLFTAMVSWAIYLLLALSRRHQVIGVLLLLLSVFVRPSAIGLGVAAAVVVGWWGIRPRLRGVAMGLAATAVLIGMLTIWAARNKSVLGVAVWTTTNSGYTAYDSFNPLADGSSNQASFRLTMRDPAVAAAVGEALGDPYRQWRRLRALGEVGRDDLFRRLAGDYAREHPARLVSLAFAKLGRFWSPWPRSADFGDWRYALIGGTFIILFFGLVLIGVWRGGLPRRTTLILLLPAIYFSAVHCVFVGSLRYRVPCDVPLAVLAGVGAASFGRRKAVNE